MCVIKDADLKCCCICPVEHVLRENQLEWLMLMTKLNGSETWEKLSCLSKIKAGT